MSGRISRPGTSCTATTSMRPSCICSASITNGCQPGEYVIGVIEVTFASAPGAVPIGIDYTAEHLNGTASVAHIGAGDLPQFPVDEGPQLRRRFPTARGPFGKQTGDFTRTWLRDHSPSAVSYSTVRGLRMHPAGCRDDYQFQSQSQFRQVL